MNMIVHTMLRDPPPATPASYHALEREYGARNYKPFDVVLSRGLGVWVWDIAGRRYLDCLSAYSAVNQGHCHPRILAALAEQASRLAITSRAFMNDQLPLFYMELCALTHSHKVLPMNSGAEAVESAIKVARKWGYEVKGVPNDRAEVIVCANNFHGRTLTIVGFSTDPTARDGFGPVHAGIPRCALCRPLRARSGDHGCLPGRAHPGRGGGDNSTCGLFQIGARDLYALQRDSDSRRDSDWARPHRPAARRRA
jgi:4-aminobutyrate aminotransferase-like enzyme